MSGTRKRKLVSLNTERSKHLPRIFPFLKGTDADVICLQEVCARDLPRFQDELGMEYRFAPVGLHPDDESAEPILTGIATFSRLPFSESEEWYYSGTKARALGGNAVRHPSNRPVLICRFENNGLLLPIGNTHFNWSSNGQPTDEQRTSARILLRILEKKMPQGAFCGDFNAPREFEGRPGEIYSMLTQGWRDVIPRKEKTSIDIALHRNGATNAHELKERMVDYLLMRGCYRALEVKLVSGVSDHKAIVAIVTTE